MILTTSIDVPGKKYEILGVVVGNNVMAKNIGRDFMAGMKNIVGGEIKSYTDLLSESRELSKDRMVKVAEEKGADAVINLRFSSSSIMAGSTEIICYGTAIKFI